MKILISLLFGAIFLLAGELRVAKDYADGVQIAKKENKKILLMLSREGCKACIYMHDTALKDDAVVDSLSGYVVIFVDIFEDEWNKKFRAYVTPTFFVLDKNENKIGKQIVGAMEPSEFAKAIRNIEVKK